MRITNREEFVSNVEVGTILYMMHSWHGKPSYLERVEIVSISHEPPPDGVWGVESETMFSYISPKFNHIFRDNYLSDAINKWHGLWTEEKEAVEYFHDRKLAYEIEPELIKEVEDSMKWMEEFRKQSRDLLGF